jgi:hypothetical protein
MGQDDRMNRMGISREGAKAGTRKVHLELSTYLFFQKGSEEETGLRQATGGPRDGIPSAGRAPYLRSVVDPGDWFV